MLKKYTDSRRCGTVKIEADLDLPQNTDRRNCSICRRNRFWPAVAGPDGFRLIAGATALAEYLSKTKNNQHFF